MREIKFRAWTGEKMEYEIKDFSRDYVMQFTGLRDKNGKEIYEGDIVKSNEFNDQILIACNLLYNCLGIVDLPLQEQWQPLDMEDLEKSEVIGNCFENPELLTQ